MLFTRSFEAVLDFIQFGLLFCSFFTVLGVIKLRITRPDLPRPYRAWGYPVTPVVFLLVTGLHDVLSFDGAAVAVVSGYFDNDFGPFDLRRFPQAPVGHRDRIPGPRIEMLQPLKMTAVVATMFLAVAAPARAADIVTADDTARFLAGMPPSAIIAADAADQGSGVAAPRTILRYRVRAARAAPAFENPGLGRRQSGGAAADHVLHVQRSGLPLCGRVLFQGDDLRAERARAGRIGA